MAGRTEHLPVAMLLILLFDKVQGHWVCGVARHNNMVQLVALLLGFEGILLLNLKQCFTQAVCIRVTTTMIEL